MVYDVLRAMVYAMQDWYSQVHDMCMIMPEVMTNILQHLISLLSIYIALLHYGTSCSHNN